MSNEEAIEWFKNSAFYHKDHEPFNMAIKALSQEPCDDMVSRKKAIYVISACDGKSAQIEALEQLPSVTQKSESVTEFADRCRECGKMRKGHWINLEKKCKGQVLPFWGRYGCSKCGGYGEGTFNYCPNCGAKMESEDRE